MLVPLLAWSLLTAGCLLGLLGIVLPILPGMALILLGAVLHKLLLPEILSWWSVSFVGALFLISLVADFASSLVGARLSGATRWGVWGAGLGALVGLFFFPLGLLLGPLLGAFLAEALLARRTLARAALAGAGAGAGTLLALAFRLPLALGAIAALLFDLFG